jgi:hypothetical protein
LASLAAIGLGVVTVFLLVRLQKQASPSLATHAEPSRSVDLAAIPVAPGESRLAARSDETEKPRTAFDALPRGTQTFDGVTFQIRRPLNIIGTRAALANGQEFARVSNQPVTGRGKHIHVLHTGDHGISPNGTFIWRLVLHYADGESRRFDFAYGVHLRNYWWRPNQRDDDLSDPDSSITWTGTSVESDRKGAQLRLSRTTLLNPKPEVEVTSADYTSLLGQSSAYVFAVTLADNGPAPRSSEGLTATNILVLPFLVQTGNGVSDKSASLDYIFECNGFTVRCPDALADGAGRVTVDIPIDSVSVLRYTARNSSGAVRSGIVEVGQGAKLPPEQLIRFVPE